MNKFARIIIVILTLFLVMPKAFADETAEVLSWQDCVNMALSNNNSLKSANAGQQANEDQKNAALSGFLPQVSGSLISNRGNNGNSSNPSQTTVDNKINQAYSGTLSLKQNVFSGFSDVGKFDQAKSNYMISKANVDIVKAQVSYDLVASFQNLIYAKDNVKLLSDIMHRREDNLQIIELRFKGGMENKGSLLLARAYLDQAKYDLMQGNDLIESARAQLCKALGVSECKEFDINGMAPVSEPDNDKINFSELILQTPLHNQLQAQEDAARSGITIAKSAFFPTFDVTANKGKRGESLFPQNGFWSVGMNLNWSFFSGAKDYYNTGSANQTLKAAKENLQATDQQILVNLKQAYNSYLEAIVKLKVDDNFQIAAKMRAEIARNKYNNGLLIFEDWDTIETDLINRQKSYLQSKLNRVVNEASWKQVQGKGVF